MKIKTSCNETRDGFYLVAETDNFQYTKTASFGEILQHKRILINASTVTEIKRKFSLKEVIDSILMGLKNNVEQAQIEFNYLRSQQI